MSFGVIVNTRTAPPAKGAPTSTGTLFMAAEMTVGPTNAAQGPFSSTADFEAVFGARSAGNQAAWDALDLFIREGGRRAYVAAFAAPDTNLSAALGLFGPKLGPGQVIVIGTAAPLTAAEIAAVASHCQNNNRVGLLDVTNDAVVANWQTQAGLMPTDATAEYVAMFGSWVNVPAPAGISGASPRVLPASPAIAALCARVDANGNPNRAAAGRDYPLQYVSSFVYDPTDTERAALFAAGVNAFTNSYGVLVNYGFQTKIPVSETTPFWGFNCSRARMWLKAQAQAIGANYMFKNIDGSGHLAGALKTDLLVPCLQLYGVDGLYGATAADAFSINVSTSVNTTATAAQGSLNAVMSAKFGSQVRSVDIDLVSVPVAGVVQQ